MLGKDHPDLAKSMIALGRMYNSQHKFKEAETLYKNALSIQEQALGRKNSHITKAKSYFFPGKNHVEVGTTLRAIASILAENKKFDIAEDLLDRSLSIYQQKLGEEHPLTAELYRNIASLQSDKGNYQRSCEIYKKSLQLAVSNVRSMNLT